MAASKNFIDHDKSVQIHSQWQRAHVDSPPLSCHATGISEGDPGAAEEPGPRKAEDWTPPRRQRNDSQPPHVVRPIEALIPRRCF